MTEREIFLEALEMSTPEARAAYLQGACGRDGTLRRKVEELLREHFSSDSLIAGPAVDGERPGTAEFPIEQAPAQMIGRYKLLEKIGEGGFGEVWMAEQRDPVKRRVALKIIKLGMESRQIVARFEAERQALAMMDHANIARIFDAGVTDNGRPYFVMELVRGLKITDYCDQNQLPTEERLKLFILVCQAIQHAHQKGIIHRDIKPSNILVTLHDGVPVPKVIDFGIAKATQQELTDKTVFTQFQQFMGTPAYISPEQAELSGLDIDTRADIYSLGVLLYELLVGQTPFDAKEMIQGGLDALRQIIREKEPLRPSTKLNTLQGDARTTAGKRRQTDVGRLVHQLQGDLDWIVMKCLEKDRQRRYETANGLAADIQRHMKNEPVLARPPSKLYEFQKTVKRHKIGFAAAGAVILALAIGLGIATWTLVKEKKARERAVTAEQEQGHLRQQAEDARTRAEANENKAETEAERSAQVARFMRDMLQGVGPGVARGHDTKLLREILDLTAQRLNGLKEQPEVEAELRGTLGNVYSDLGEYTNAETMSQGCLELRRKVYGQEHPEVASALNDLAETIYRNGRLYEAEAMHRQALAMREKLFGSDNPDVATSQNNLGEVLRKRRKYAEAESLFREALATRRKLFGNEHLDVAASLKNLGLLLWQAKKFTEAELMHRESLAIRQKLLGDAHPDVAASLDLLAKALGSQGKKEAAVCFDQSLAMRRKCFGNDHPEVAFSFHNLGEWFQGQGNLPKAEEMFRQALMTRIKVLGVNHYDTRHSLSYLRDVLRGQRKTAETEALYRDVLAFQRKEFEHGNRWMPETLLNLADLLAGQGKMAEAEALTREAVPLYSESAATGNIAILNRLAWLLATSAFPKVRDGQAAAGFAEQAVAATGRKDPENLDTLAAAYAEMGQFPKAILVQREALALLQNDEQKMKNFASRLRLYESGLAYRDHDALALETLNLLAVGKFAEAELLARECLAIREKAIPNDWLTFNSRSMLGGILLGQKKYAEAESFLLSGYEGMKQRETSIPNAGKMRIPEAIQRVVELYEATGKPEKAAEWKKLLASDQAKAEK